MTTADDFLTAFDGEELLADLKRLIRHGYENIPRHTQRELGPSQIGHECPRHLALATVAPEEGVARYNDPLPSLTGTAIHSLIESFVPAYNALIGEERFIAERKVFMREGFGGTADLYDTLTDTVIDWKNPSPARTAKYIKDPGSIYKRQAHLYGLGYEREGYPVKNVAVCLLPRGGQLRNAKLWAEPYDRQLALDTMKRYDQILVLADELDVEHHPERFTIFPAVPNDMCEYCPFFSPAPDGNPYRCAGGELEES
jgi:hypothetical protein